MTKLVAITGKRGHGKDTAAHALAEHGGFVHMHFADPLREIVHIAYGITMEEMMDPILKEKVLDRYPHLSPRHVLTHVGTESFRHFIDDTWVRALERRSKEYDKVVISDLRFLNEEKMLKANGATIIRVVNPRRNDTDAVSQHRSETEMDDIIPHITIFNEGTISELHTKVLNAVLGNNW